jgi:hypothetical protein
LEKPMAQNKTRNHPRARKNPRQTKMVGRGGHQKMGRERPPGIGKGVFLVLWMSRDVLLYLGKYRAFLCCEIVPLLGEAQGHNIHMSNRRQNPAGKEIINTVCPFLGRD